jgi:hypothetical protein
MWVWVTDQLWTFICSGIAGGILVGTREAIKASKERPPAEHTEDNEQVA